MTPPNGVVLSNTCSFESQWPGAVMNINGVVLNIDGAVLNLVCAMLFGILLALF